MLQCLFQSAAEREAGVCTSSRKAIDVDTWRDKAGPGDLHCRRRLVQQPFMKIDKAPRC